MLDRNDETYTRFRVLTHLAAYALIANDTDRVFDAGIAVSELAVGSYAGEASYVDRATESLLRLLSFAEDHSNALRLAATNAGTAGSASAAVAALVAGDYALAERLAATLSSRPDAVQIELRLACHANRPGQLAAAVAAAEEALSTASGDQAQELALWLALVATAQHDDLAAFDRAVTAYRRAQSCVLRCPGSLACTHSLGHSRRYAWDNAAKRSCHRAQHAGRCSATGTRARPSR